MSMWQCSTRKVCLVYLVLEILIRWFHFTHAAAVERRRNWYRNLLPQISSAQLIHYLSSTNNNKNKNKNEGKLSNIPSSPTLRTEGSALKPGKIGFRTNGMILCVLRFLLFSSFPISPILLFQFNSNSNSKSRSAHVILYFVPSKQANTHACMWPVSTIIYKRDPVFEFNRLAPAPAPAP